MSVWRQVFSCICILSVLSFVGCATIIHGNSQDIGLASSPTGAICKVNNQTTYTTPATLDLKRNKTYSLRCEKEGYEEGSATITSSVSGWVWGNILFGGLIGLVVDFSSGGAKKLKPDNVNIVLAKTTVPATVTEEGQIAPTEEKKDSLKTVEQELDELAEMKAEGKINEVEYKMLRQKIIERY